jgi:hypothetical protein
VDITIHNPKIDQNIGSKITPITIFSNIENCKYFAMSITIRYAMVSEPKIEKINLMAPNVLLLSL